MPRSPRSSTSTSTSTATRTLPVTVPRAVATAGLAALLAATLGATLAACGDDAGAAPDAAPVEPDALTLPGNFYPESLSASADGTLYVGSITTGQVVAFDDGATTPRTVIGAGSGITGITGVLVHADELFVCSVDTTFQRPSDVVRLALDGSPLASYTLGAGRLCNDMAFDATGNLYVTDSLSGTVLRLAAGAHALEPWLSDPSLAPATQGALGLDGVVVIGSAVYLTKLDTGGIYRVAINGDGTAGAVTPIAVTPALTAPDGLRVHDDHTLLVVDNAGKLIRLALAGDAATATTLAGGLDQPTGVIVSRGAAWVSLGQIGRLFAQPPQAPNLPFAVVRVAL